MCHICHDRPCICSAAVHGYMPVPVRKITEYTVYPVMSSTDCLNRSTSGRSRSTRARYVKFHGESLYILRGLMFVARRHTRTPFRLRGGRTALSGPLGRAPPVRRARRSHRLQRRRLHNWTRLWPDHPTHVAMRLCGGIIATMTIATATTPTANR